MKPKIVHAFILTSLAKLSCIAVLAQSATAPLVAKQEESNNAGVVRLKRLTIKLKLKEVAFVDALNALNSASQLDFIADDVPSNEKISINYEGELATAIDKIASFYDYSWKVGKSGEIQMMKKFSAEHDYPQAHAGEIAQVVKEMQSVLASIGAFPGEEHRIPATTKKFYRSLTQDQVRLLKSSYEMPASQLSEVQFQLLREVAASHLFSGDAELWNEAYFRLSNLPRSVMYYMPGDFHLLVLSPRAGADPTQCVYLRNFIDPKKLRKNQ